MSFGTSSSCWTIYYERDDFGFRKGRSIENDMPRNVKIIENDQTKHAPKTNHHRHRNDTLLTEVDFSAHTTQSKYSSPLPSSSL
jgi:hypothetical protein